MRSLSEPAKHYYLIIFAIGSLIVAIERWFWWEPFRYGFLRGSGVDDYVIGAAVLLILLLYAFFVICSAVWSIFGDGRWAVRFSLSFLLFQFLLLILLVLVGHRADDNNQLEDFLAIWAPASAIYLILWSIMLLPLWGLKRCRYRMIYLDRSNLAPDEGPHEYDLQVQESSSSGIVLKGVYSIADLLLLTAWVAIVLSASIQVYQVFYGDSASSSDRFMLVVSAVGISVPAVIGLFTLAPSLILALRDSRTSYRYLLLQAFISLHLIIWIFGLNRIDFLVDEGLTFAIIGSMFFLCFQMLLSFLLTPNRRLVRFRFIKIEESIQRQTVPSYERPNSDVEEHVSF